MPAGLLLGQGLPLKLVPNELGLLDFGLALFWTTSFLHPGQLPNFLLAFGETADAASLVGPSHQCTLPFGTSDEQGAEQPLEWTLGPTCCLC